MEIFMAGTSATGEQPARLELFADMQAITPCGQIVAFSTRRSRWLLAHLALDHGKWVQREELVTALWPDVDAERSRRLLETELWRLRDSLRRANVGVAFLISGLQGALRLENSPSLAIDVMAFRQAISACAQSTVANTDRELSARRRRAISLYGGSLCPGIQTEGVIAAREYLRSTFINCLEAELACQVSLCNWAEVIELATRLIAEDCLLEHAHRQLINAYWSLQDRARALAQYHRLEALLRHELDVAPMAETRRLFERITSQTDCGRSVPLSEAETRSLHSSAGRRLPAGREPASPDRRPYGDGHSVRRLREMAGELSLIASTIEAH
jgi:DNA-binding SARP family transcriptional activator